MPLYHFATSDLPADTIAPEMSDTNTEKSLLDDGADPNDGFVDEKRIGIYLSYLNMSGFLDEPTLEGKDIPDTIFSWRQKVALKMVGGRGALR
jgi:L-aminoadipate-semialdehyde dehydrogenase